MMNAIETLYEKLCGSRFFYPFRSEEGMGVVEVILIIVVLIGLVTIFQTNIKGVVASIFATIQQNASAIQ